MVEINLNPETPSQAIVKAANTTVSVTDTLGRVIVLKKFNAIDRMQLFKAAGPVNVQNLPYLNMATQAFHVQSIDGEAVPRPTNENTLEFLIKRLDVEGLDAIDRGLHALYPQEKSEDKDSAKN